MNAWKRMIYRCSLGLTVSLVLLEQTAHAGTIGMVAGNAHVESFNADTDESLGGAELVGSSLFSSGDCAIRATATETIGYVATLSSQIYIVDLDVGPPEVIGTIPISNPGQDIVLTPDGNYLVVCSGIPFPLVSVIDVRTSAETSTFDLGLGTNCTSVDVCSDGSVLVTSDGTPDEMSTVRRLTINASGGLMDTGEELQFFARPSNVYCAPDAAAGVVLTGDDGHAVSFAVQGLVAVDTRPLSAVVGMSGAFDGTGGEFYARSSSGLEFEPGFVDAFGFAPMTGALSQAPLFTSELSIGGLAEPGTDQLPVHPDGTRLYVSQFTTVSVLDAATGGHVDEIATSRPRFSSLTGVCVATADVLPLPPANDDIQRATVVTEPLSFIDDIKTAAATTALDDPSCSGNGHTVWYTYTPTVSRRIEARTDGSDYLTTLSVYTGSPGALSQIACNDVFNQNSLVSWDAVAGETYYIMAGSIFDNPGGNLVFTVEPALAIDVTLNPSGSMFVGTGDARVTGTVTCTRPVDVSISGSLRQRAGRTIVEGPIDASVFCEGSATWSALVDDPDALFAGGPAAFQVDAHACDRECADDAATGTVRLRGGK
ncbi:YncE family protein [Sorangium sp. So ce381]|uniref:YncE family protein n=1 Tax=Sorangium sp. So ce381 TaxID=3133307 RepID=UPI003F5BE836